MANKKSIFTALLVISCVTYGCSSDAQKQISDVKGLEGCVAIQYNYSNWHSDAVVIRCPLSSTSTTVHVGKSSIYSATVIDVGAK